MTEQPQSAKASKVLGFLEKLALPVHVHHHPPVFTVAEAQALRGNIPGGHTKNLFLRDRKNNYILVTVMETALVDLKTLHDRVNAVGRLSFASAQRLNAVLGVQPGAVSPLALVNDARRQCRLLLDEAMFGCRQINFHPLDNTMTVSISPEHLVTFLEATGHAPTKLPFPQAQARD